MAQHVITFNAGSSSIKFALFEAAGGEPAPLGTGEVEMRGGSERSIFAKNEAGKVLIDHTWTDTKPFHSDALHRMLDLLKQASPDIRITAGGHRVVHGGVHYTAPVIVTDEVIDGLRSLTPLAPLHEPHNIAGMLAAREAWPNIPQVACFDTSFHRGHPFVDDTFALPRRFYEEGVRRYGFHGLSYQYIIGRLKEIAPEQAAGRVVAAHLGNGASMCAMLDGRSISSTMGFTALDGLPMGTRCGQLDPGAMLYFMEEKHMTGQELSDLLYRELGLKGLSGLSHDMRELERAGTPEARQAIEYFTSRIRRELGALAATLRGLDAVVFSAGIGEHSWRVREQALEGTEWMGIEQDQEANRKNDTVISTQRSRVRVFVIATNEEAMIARHTLATIGHASSG